jgi:hypothetical protein
MKTEFATPEKSRLHKRKPRAYKQNIGESKRAHAGEFGIRPLLAAYGDAAGLLALIREPKERQ